MPSTYQALLCIALGVAPGYVFYSVVGAITIREIRGNTALLIESVVGSMVFWAVIGPVIYALSLNKLSVAGVVVCAGIASLIVPTALGFAWGAMERSGALRKRLSIRSPVPTSWDYRFGLKEPMWVLVTMADGSLVGGIWGPHSFASSYPSDTDLYIEKVYNLDARGKYLEECKQSKGVWVAGSAIKCIEFFSMEVE